MATTLKKSISPDSPQCEEQCVATRFQSFTKFSKIYSIYNVLLQTIFQTAPHFLTLGVAVPNTINTCEFHPSIVSGSKFKIPSQYFAVTFLALQILVNLHFYFFYMLSCLHSINQL